MYVKEVIKTATGYKMLCSPIWLLGQLAVNPFKECRSSDEVLLRKIVAKVIKFAVFKNECTK